MNAPNHVCSEPGPYAGTMCAVFCFGKSDQEHAQMLALLQIAALLAPVNLMPVLRCL